MAKSRRFLFSMKTAFSRIFHRAPAFSADPIESLERHSCHHQMPHRIATTSSLDPKYISPRDIDTPINDPEPRAACDQSEATTHIPIDNCLERNTLHTEVCQHHPLYSK